MILAAFLPYIVPISVVAGLVTVFELMAALHIRLFVAREQAEAPVRFEFDPASLEHLPQAPPTAAGRVHG